MMRPCRGGGVRHVIDEGVEERHEVVVVVVRGDGTAAVRLIEPDLPPPNRVARHRSNGTWRV
jgi:hypothetical protein